MNRLLLNALKTSTPASVSAAWTPLELFSSGEDGYWYDASVLSSLWSDVGRSTPASVDGPVQFIDDLSGNGWGISTSLSGPGFLVLRQDGPYYYIEFTDADTSKGAEVNGYHVEGGVAHCEGAAIFIDSTSVNNAIMLNNPYGSDDSNYAIRYRSDLLGQYMCFGFKRTLTAPSVPRDQTFEYVTVEDPIPPAQIFYSGDVNRFELNDYNAVLGPQPLGQRLSIGVKGRMYSKAASSKLLDDTERQQFETWLATKYGAA